ncbi:MAG: hypothetical protein QX203_12155 [Methylococcaceae bacterium]
MGSPEIVSAAAAVVSAVGGAFAALAAFRSADSARVTQRAAEAAEHRVALRQIGTTATEVFIEKERITSRGTNLKMAYQTLFAFAGQLGGSRKNFYESAVDEKVQHASKLGEYAKLFTTAAEKLDGTPPEETDRVQVRLSNSLTEIRALREDLERELSGVEGQSATYRENAIKGTM